MKIFRSLLRLLSYVAIFFVYVEAVELGSIVEVQSHVFAHKITHGEDRLLVALDLDNTVMHPDHEDHLCSDQWVEATLNYLRERHLSHIPEKDAFMTALKILIPPCFDIHHVLRMRLVEDQMGTFIRELQAAGISVIGLTARSHQQVACTMRQLDDINVDFSLTCPTPEENLQLRHIKGLAPCYMNGILFCSFNPKGGVLADFINAMRADKKPNSVIFIDDKEKHVDCVRNALKALNIPYLGLRYGAADQFVKSYVLPETTKNLFDALMHPDYLQAEEKAKTFLRARLIEQHLGITVDTTNTRANYTIEEISHPSQSFLEEVCTFRLNVWKEETVVNDAYVQELLWIDRFDKTATYWVVKESGTNIIIGCARLTIHEKLEDSPSGPAFLEHKRSIPSPYGYLSSIAVTKKFRRQGIGKKLNELGIAKAKSLGVKSLITTATDNNARILKSLGFIESGFREEAEPDRPLVDWVGLELIF